MATRATKIVATLGPATSDPALLVAMLRAGVNVVRLNFSHGIAQDHIDRAAAVREAAKEVGREVAIMADLQGPKIRVGKFADGKVHLVEGASFVLDAARETLGDIEAVGLDYKGRLPDPVRIRHQPGRPLGWRRAGTPAVARRGPRRLPGRTPRPQGW